MAGLGIGVKRLQISSDKPDQSVLDEFSCHKPISFIVSEIAKRLKKELAPLTKSFLATIIANPAAAKFVGPLTLARLAKYAALINEKNWDLNSIEATVHVFLIELFQTLSFRDWNLVILSKSVETFFMNGEPRHATPDVAILNMRSQHRLVGLESKPTASARALSTRIQQKLPQLVAEAIAVCQSNKELIKEPSRPSQSVFAILVFGTQFVFYRAEFTNSFLDRVADYSKLNETAEVVELSNNGQPFSFLVPNERDMIIELLDRIHQNADPVTPIRNDGENK